MLSYNSMTWITDFHDFFSPWISSSHQSLLTPLFQQVSVCVCVCVAALSCLTAACKQMEIMTSFLAGAKKKKTEEGAEEEVPEAWRGSDQMWPWTKCHWTRSLSWHWSEGRRIRAMNNLYPLFEKRGVLWSTSLKCGHQCDVRRSLTWGVCGSSWFHGFHLCKL